ncbi:DUF2786 domain-containing protein [Rhodococcus sp. ABRD24]|uniref:DUF2786 domain-containing protein n=1 Tax=Rhodococcus sp. ABRD24 TaxID=2507582 RepID=UPI00103EEF01|nr:DUF2786 domain-containing protein [Rhodococcus sp. ABRD24]QBJ97582.1 DUF2786 domain-containing protein [Rhodococcus sp. ABRD24]
MGRNRTYIRSAESSATEDFDEFEDSFADPFGDDMFDDFERFECPPPRGRSITGMLTALAEAYERGWQPADVMHVTRRTLGSDSTAVTAATLLYQYRASGAAERAPHEWATQLDQIAERESAAALFAAGLPDGCDSDAFGAALDSSGWHLGDNESTAMTLLWLELPRVTELCEPPSSWPRIRVEPAQTAADETADPKVLNKIRGLLAKAEATEFVEEAETFTAKAQELMTRYAVTAALLHAAAAGTPTVRSRRIHLDNPYVKEKVHLLTAIGDANRVRTVWFDRFGIATVVGSPLDLDQVDLLFTSLLIQATRAMQESAPPAKKGSRTTSFRKAFLFGFAVRIGQRLKEAGSRATAEAAAEAAVPVGELVPVLAARSEAVDAEFDRLFPNTKTFRSRSVDAVGWHAGQSAADDASLAPGGRAIPR